MTQSPISNPRSPISKPRLGYWLLITLLLCTIAVAPLLRDQTPCTHDGAFHYYRVAAMRHALRNGILFTRYLPDLAFGYGYPFFNYRAALSYYLALALHLTGLALPLSLNLVYVLSMLGSALGAFLLARDLFGPQAGVIAAVAYAYAPYQFLDALLRANAPESVALPLFPLILWAFRRLALTGQRRWFLASVGSLAALLVTHNISSLIFVPFVLPAYLFMLWLVYRREGHWVTAGSALVLAFGLTAFFLGPALLEQDYAQLHMSHVTRNNDFHYNFLSLSEIFAPPAPVDTSLMNPPMHVHLGLALTILACIGFVTGLTRWRDRERRATLVFLALLAAAMLWMSTRASLWLWEHVPLLPFVQFPWRFVGRAILPLAMLAAATVPTPSRIMYRGSSSTFHVSRFTHHAPRIAYCVIVAGLILSAFPYTYPPHGYCPNGPHPSIKAVFKYEHKSKLVGVDPEGSYFPVWVKQRPDGSPLEEQYAASGPVARFDEAVLPAGAAVVEADYGPNRAQVVIETPAPFRARYLAFYFPGWRVRLDGEPVKATPSDPEGLITFDVPAGRHTVAVRFGLTPLRTIFTAVSLLSLAALLVLTIRNSEFGIRSTDPAPRSSQPAIRNSELATPAWLLITALLVLAFKLAVVDRTDTVFRRPTLRPDGTLPGVEHSLNQPYADGMTLIGYDQDRTAMPADGTLRIDLYWTAYARPNARYQTVIHLVGSDGARWSLPDTFRPRDYAGHPRTYHWKPGRYALDSHEIETLPGTPPGTYAIILTVFDRKTLAPLSLLDEYGQSAAPELILGQITLKRPRHPAELPSQDRIDLSLPEFTILTADFDRDQAAPGDTAYLTMMWQAKREGYAPSSMFPTSIVLLTPDGSDAATYWVGHPVGEWKDGDVWRSQHALTLSATLETGTYAWVVRWPEMREESKGIIGQISITAPPHVFDAPPVDIEIDTPLGDVATLIGINLQSPIPNTQYPAQNLQPGTPLTTTLVWRVETTPPDSYHVFLHLLDLEGRLITQSDGIPAGWSRPTTGWLPGEYIPDVRVLTIPPDAPAGEYILSTGMYIPDGARLTTPDGSDAISLSTVTVAPKE